MVEEVVLAYIEKNNQYLMLLRNKRDKDINKGKYIGVGGHLEKGETKEEALVREIKEETNLDVVKYEYRGRIVFENTSDNNEIMYLFHVSEVKGEISECDEGTLSWIDKDKIFDLNLWEGDIIFLKPFMESNDFINLFLRYDGDKLISYKFNK